MPGERRFRRLLTFLVAAHYPPQPRLLSLFHKECLKHVQVLPIGETVDSSELTG